MVKTKKESKLNQVLLLIASVEKEPGITKKKLCARFDLTEAELDAILDMVWCCGLPGYTPYDLIEVIREGDRVWIKSADFFKRPVRLSLPEAFAIALGADLLDSLGSLDNPTLRRAAGKVKEALPDESHLKLEELTSRVRMRLEPAWYQEMLSKIRVAIEKQLTIEVTYYARGRGKTTRRKIDPYFLSWSSGQHYLVGYCHMRRGERIFKLENISGLNMTKDGFARPADFDPEKYLSSAIYVESPQDKLVELLYKPSIATWIREKWGQEQIECLKDGSVILRMRSGNLGWLAKELLEYGDQVKVLEPPELREALLEKARGLRARYEKQ